MYPCINYDTDTIYQKGTNMPTSKPSIPKNRATVTASMVAKILYLAKTESPITEEAIQLVAKFAPLQAKIDNAGLTPAYITTPAISKLESLGGIDTTVKDDSYTLAGHDYPTKELYWEACYKLYSSNPELCNLSTISSAREHMYLNDLMSEEEVNEFEAGAV